MRGKVVLITGASSGIGAGTASYLAAQGCLLSLTGRNQEGLGDTLRACLQAGLKEDQVLLIPADLQDTDNLSSIVQKTLIRFGKLDVLVNNAGMVLSETLENMSVEDYDRIMNVNLKSVFFLTQSAMPHLIQSGGNVINVSSVIGQRTVKSSIAYSMSKAALDHFTRTVALEVGSKGVRVNSVNLGLIETPLLYQWDPTFDFDLVGKAAHPIGRGGSVDEVARAIAFLANNDQASFVTGVTMLVDGGFCLLSG